MTVLKPQERHLLMHVVASLIEEAPRTEVPNSSACVPRCTPALRCVGRRSPRRRGLAAIGSGKLGLLELAGSWCVLALGHEGLIKCSWSSWLL